MDTFTKLAVAGFAALGLSVAKADFVIEDFSVLQSVTVGAGEIGGQTVGNGTTSCWYMVACYRDIVIDNSAANHATTASVLYNSQTPTIGPNYEFRAHVAAGDTVKFIITWDGDTISGNFGSVDPYTDRSFPVTYPAYFMPYVFSSSGQANNPKVTVTMKDVNDRLSVAELAAFDQDSYRADDYAAPLLAFNYCGYSGFGSNADPSVFDCEHLVGIQAVVTIDASAQAVDFAMRRLKAPEPGSMALAGLALLALSSLRRRIPRA